MGSAGFDSITVSKLETVGYLCLRIMVSDLSVGQTLSWEFLLFMLWPVDSTYISSGRFSTVAGLYFCSDSCHCLTCEWRIRQRGPIPPQGAPLSLSFPLAVPFYTSGVLCILLSPFPNGCGILVLMIWGDEDEVQKQTALKVCWGFAFVYKNERRLKWYWVEG